MYVQIKRSKARERYGAGYAVTSSIVAVIVFSAVTSVIHAVTDADVGRTFILNPEYLSWEAAKQKCQDLNGVLAKVDAFHVVPELGYDEEWTLWVGLKVLSMDNLTWEDGSEVNWTNWYIVDWDKENPACVTIVTTPPYSWVMTSCNKTLPSLCEIPGGACNFTKTEHASLKAFNDRHVYEDAASCMKMCEETRELDCRSLEVQRANAKTCQLSIESRWTQPQDFITADRYWDYYHWTCINGTYLGGVYVSPNGAYLPSTEATTVPPTEPTTVPPTEPTTVTPTEPTTTTDPDVVCVKIKPIPENETEEVHEEVKELRTLAATFTEQKKMKKRISTTDPRPSATYVGSLAVGLVLGVLGLVVCLDLLSLPRHVSEMARRGACCGQCTKRFKKKRKDKDMRFTEFGGRPTRRFGPLMIGARMPRNFKPKRLPKDKRVESTYNSTTSGEDKSQKLELHLERIRQLEQGLGVKTGPSRSGSALSLDEEQEDEIVRVEQSDDPDVSETAVGPTTMNNAEDEDVDADDLESFKRSQPQVTMLRPGFFVPDEDVCIERRVERFRSRPPPVLMNNQEDEGEEEEEEQEEGEEEEEEEEEEVEEEESDDQDVEEEDSGSDAFDDKTALDQVRRVAKFTVGDPYDKDSAPKIPGEGFRSARVDPVGCSDTESRRTSEDTDSGKSNDTCKQQTVTLAFESPHNSNGLDAVGPQKKNTDREKDNGGLHKKRDRRLRRRQTVEDDTDRDNTHQTRNAKTPQDSQRSNTSNTYFDTRSKPRSNGAVPNKQPHIEILIDEADTSEEEGTQVGSPGPLDLDDNRLKVGEFPQPMENLQRPYYSSTNTRQAWRL